MTIPESIKVGGITYKVDIVEDIDKTEAQGEVDYEGAHIRIKKTNEDSMKQTFLHELFHTMNIDFDEERVEFLSVILYQIIKDNPSVFSS